MVIGKRFHWYCLQNPKPNKKLTEMGRFFTVDMSSKYNFLIFWCILNIVSYKTFYPIVYDNGAFEKKSFCHSLDWQ